MQKKHYILISLILLSWNFVFSQDTILNKAWGVGEYLKYRVYYSSSLGDFTAGEAILTVEEWEGSPYTEPQNVYKITGVGNSKGMFNWFYKVRDRFESFVNKSTILPYLFIRKTREGKYKQDDVVVFKRKENLAITNNNERSSVPDDVHDFVSALYYMRTISVNDFNADSMFFINFFLDDSVYTSAIKYHGKEIIETQWGPLVCLKIAPMMASGEVFADKYPMFVYVTDDDSHVPIFAKSEVIVGSVKMELIEFKNVQKCPDQQLPLTNEGSQ